MDKNSPELNQMIPFRRWMRQQERRDDPVGDIARDMTRDPGQVLPNPSLNVLYHHIRIVGCREALEALICAYREWQSLGNTYRQTRGAPRQFMSLRLRFRVFKRDEYRCQLCGRSTRHGVVLEVDHKVPVSKGGTDDIANLWTLCFDCNRGKYNDCL